MKRNLFLIFFVLCLPCAAQETWYGEIGVYGGGGVNDIFRIRELIGAGSYSGNGFYTGGVRVRRMIGDWFSVESGVSYSGQMYTMHSAPVPETHTSTGSFGMLSVPVIARADFLKYLFADAGVIAGLQTGSSQPGDLSGIGLTAGVGLKYQFKSDVILTLRGFGTQHSLLRFSHDDYPYTLLNTRITIGIGYRFIHLGKCHCPEGNTPGRKFF